MGAVAEAVVERVEDEVALDLGDGAADRGSRLSVSAACAARMRIGAAASRSAVGQSGSRRRRSRRRAPAARRGAWCSRARARCRARDGRAARGARPARARRLGTPLASAYFSTKCSASSRMSSGRSRSGGMLQVDDVEAEIAGPRGTCLAAPASARLRLEVAMMRMSTGTGLAAADAVDHRAPGGRAAAWPAGGRPSRRSRRAAACRRRPPRTCRCAAPRRR